MSDLDRKINDLDRRLRGVEGELKRINERLSPPEKEVTTATHTLPPDMWDRYGVRWTCKGRYENNDLLWESVQEMPMGRERIVTIRGSDLEASGPFTSKSPLAEDQEPLPDVGGNKDVEPEYRERVNLHTSVPELRVEFDDEENDEPFVRVDDIPPAPRVIDAEHVKRQRLWSLGTFGPASRTKGIVEHMRRELAEVEQDPHDLSEWADLIILAIDGAWRHGHEPQAIVDAVIEKQARNESRRWPDWRGHSEDEPIEHDRSGDQ